MDISVMGKGIRGYTCMHALQSDTLPLSSELRLTDMFSCRGVRAFYVYSKAGIGVGFGWACG